MEKNALKLLLFIVMLSVSLFGKEGQVTQKTGGLSETQVSMLYVALFNRASEGDGNRYWQSTGFSMDKLADSMLSTTDAQNYFGDSLNSNRAFVEHIYKNTLNKTPSDDPEGIVYWTNLLNSGVPRGTMVASFVTAVTNPLNAGNAQNQFNNRVTVSNYMSQNIEKTPSDYATSTSFSGNLTVTSDENSVTIAIEYIITYLKDPTTLTDKYSNFTIARTNGLEEVSKTINGLKVVVTTNEPMDEVSPNTIAIYGKIKGKSTGAFLKLNSNYSGNTKFVIKVYENSKLVALSEELSLGGEYIEFDDIL